MIYTNQLIGTFYSTLLLFMWLLSKHALLYRNSVFVNLLLQ